MNPVPTQDELAKILRESALSRFGEERTKALEPIIQETAGSIAFLADHPTALEEEPAFFF
jgi:RNase P/RNase MRP subunit POP5